MIEITDQMVESMYHSLDQEVSKHDIRIALQNALNPIPLLRDDNLDRVIYDVELVDGDQFDVGILCHYSTELWVADLSSGPYSYTIPVSEVIAYTDQKMTKRIFKSSTDSQWKSVGL